MYNSLNVSTNDAICREGHFPAYATLQPRGAAGYQSAASKRARLAAISIWRMPAKSAVCSKIGTVALRTDSGEERGRGFGSVFHLQNTSENSQFLNTYFQIPESFSVPQLP